MSTRRDRLQIVRGNSALRRSMLLTSAAMLNSAVLSLMASGAHAAANNTWVSSSSGNWSTGANWLGGSPPAVDPNGDVSLEFSAPGTYTANNDLGAFPIYDTTFDSGNGTTTLTGGDLDLSWPLSEANSPAITNYSTNPVNINNNVTFEAPSGVGGTQEYLVAEPGSTTTFNGTINLSGGSSLKMTNGQSSSSTGGPGGAMIWTQPVDFTNNPPGAYGGYFAFRIFEGTFEMGGYTIADGISDAPIINVDGINLHQDTGVNNGVQTDMYIGPEDYESNHPNDVASFYLIAAGESFNTRVQVGDAGTITIGGLNTSGTVNFNDYFLTLPTDGNGIVNGVSQTIFYSAATGGTVVQNFQLIRGGGSGTCGASIDKVGGGTWIVTAGGTSPTGEQAYNGNTTVRDGTLELAYDDTGTNYVTLPADVLSNPNGAFYASGLDGGSLGFNAPTNAVQLGDSGTQPTDNIALLTAVGAGGPRQVLHNISVNNDNPSGTTSIGVADSGIGNFMGNILLNRSVVLTSGTGGTANFSGNITGTGGISTSGTGTVSLSGTNTYGGSTSATSGTLSIAASTALPTGTAVSIAASSQMVLAVGAGDPTISTLTIASSGGLNINNNRMFLSDSAGEAAAVIGYLKSGFASGWAGPSGIFSSAAATHPGYGVGFGEGSVFSRIPAGEIEISYTLYGDINQDGAVNGTDFGILASNFGKNVTGGWEQGDFTYAGKVNATDFGLLAANFGKTASGAAVALPASDWAALDAFAAEHGLTADVPEPSSLFLAAVGAVGLLQKRRRRSAVPLPA